MTIDVAAYLGPWPYRPISGTLPDLARRMRENDVDYALLSPFEGLFYADPAPANRHLLKQIARRERLLAAPVINPRMADWQAQMELLASHPKVKAVRVAPGFHGYPVGDLAAVAAASAECGLALVVQVRMQDERSHPPPMRVPPVPLAEVAELAKVARQARVVAAAARTVEIAGQAKAIRAAGNLWLDISHLDGLDCIKSTCSAVGARRLLFATNYPFFYARSAVLKVQEAQLPVREAEALMAGNARKVLRIA